MLALVDEGDFLANRWALDVTFALEDLGRSDEAARLLTGLRASTRWHAAATAYAAGDRVGAADLLAEIGNLMDEAYARLRAAEIAGDRDQISRVLAFYRGVGASAFVRRAEALLPASA